MTDFHSLLYVLSDATFVPGVFLTCFGVLIRIAGTGAFDSLSYLSYLTLRLFSPRKKKFESRMQYLEYKLDRQKKRDDGGKMPGCILIAGIVCLVLSAILAALFSL